MALTKACTEDRSALVVVESWDVRGRGLACIGDSVGEKEGSRLSQAGVRLEHSARAYVQGELSSGKLADDSRASWCVGER